MRTAKRSQCAMQTAELIGKVKPAVKVQTFNDITR
jgi:hypothetical protein